MSQMTLTTTTASPGESEPTLTLSLAQPATPTPAQPGVTTCGRSSIETPNNAKPVQTSDEKTQEPQRPARKSRSKGRPKKDLKTQTVLSPVPTFMDRGSPAHKPAPVVSLNLEDEGACAGGTPKRKRTSSPSPPPSVTRYNSPLKTLKAQILAQRALANLPTKSTHQNSPQNLSASASTLTSSTPLSQTTIPLLTKCEETLAKCAGVMESLKKDCAEMKQERESFSLDRDKLFKTIEDEVVKAVKQAAQDALERVEVVEKKVKTVEDKMFEMEKTVEYVVQELEEMQLAEERRRLQAEKTSLARDEYQANIDSAINTLRDQYKDAADRSDRQIASIEDLTAVLVKEHSEITWSSLDKHPCAFAS